MRSASSRRCLDDALRGGVRLELTELQAAELEESLWRDLEGFVRDESRSPLQLAPRRFEVGFGSDRSAPELQRGLPLGDGLHLSGKIDRIDVDPFSARGIVQDYKSGRTAHSAKQIDEELKLQIPLYMLVLRDLVGIEPLGGVYRALAGARVTRGLLHAGRVRGPAGLPEERLPGRRRVLVARRDLARARARVRAADPRGRRQARPEGRHLPVLVRPLDDVPDRAGMNSQQTAAVEATGEVFVSAGAGTGKTTVLVERFVRAVCDAGLDVESVLVITYTRKAAGELRARIRAALHARGRPDLARRLDGAWISTIHGFCSRLLRTHPFAVGLDPRFHELADDQAAVLRGEAFERALASFCASRDPERLRLLATYGAQGLRKMLTGVYETLRSAGRDLTLELGERAGVPERLAELQEVARALAADAAATDKQLAAANVALALGSNPEQLLDLSELAAAGDRAAEFRAARDRLQQAALEELAGRDSELLQELLNLFATEYQASKSRESALDFEDLQLYARDLLRDHEQIRVAEQLRFRSIMVDEFQDTNRLQCQVVDLLRDGPGAPDVFFVGDEFQSIYGFRHADVDVFRERRAAAAQRLPLARNYRSRPEVLAAVNHLFHEEFGEGYQALAASGEFADPVFGHPVELLVADKASYREAGAPWREGEANAIARRVRELVDSGAAAPGEVVLLFAAGTDAERYESALRAQGLPTYRATGRGYFGQQQVVDLLSYLRLLHNRYDDEALAAVLASPFVGVSNDALVLIRRHASKRPLYAGIERSLPEPLSENDQRLVRAFKQRYERLVAASARLPLERLCEEIVSAHDYDLAVLAQWDGKRRYANLRKLMRLARSYEELRGADIDGFVKFIRDQEAVGASQLEAVSEEEGADAVRLLTIHAAKGLEFKVVIVADAGRDTAGAPSTDEILVGTDGRFGFRVIDPTSGKRKGVFSYEEVREAEKREDRAERLRLYYVAMTRAVDRLIVSGRDRSRARAGPRDADRLGARAARRPRGRRTRRGRAGRARTG